MVSGWVLASLSFFALHAVPGESIHILVPTCKSSWSDSGRYTAARGLDEGTVRITLGNLSVLLG